MRMIRVRSKAGAIHVRSSLLDAPTNVHKTILNGAEAVLLGCSASVTHASQKPSIAQSGIAAIEVAKSHGPCCPALARIAGV